MNLCWFINRVWRRSSQRMSVFSKISNYWQNVFQGWQVYYWKAQVSRPRSVSVSLRWCRIHCGQSKRLSSAWEWRHPWGHRNTIISTHWHHSALDSTNATPVNVPHTPPAAFCSPVIVFIRHPIVCVGARWTMSPISVKTMIQHCYCYPSSSHFTRQDGFPMW